MSDPGGRLRRLCSWPSSPAAAGTRRKRRRPTRFRAAARCASGVTEALSPLDPANIEFDPAITELQRCCLLRTLVNYRGATTEEGGTVLRPDLAVALPKVSEDGLAYTFRLKPGIRYAPPYDDVTIKAQDTVRAIEYALRLKSAPFMLVIEGAREFQNGRADTVSGLETPDDHTLSSISRSSSGTSPSGSRSRSPHRSRPARTLVTSRSGEFRWRQGLTCSPARRTSTSRAPRRRSVCPRATSSTSGSRWCGIRRGGTIPCGRPIVDRIVHHRREHGGQSSGEGRPGPPRRRDRAARANRGASGAVQGRSHTRKAAVRPRRERGALHQPQPRGPALRRRPCAKGRQPGDRQAGAAGERPAAASGAGSPAISPPTRSSTTSSSTTTRTRLRAGAATSKAAQGEMAKSRYDRDHDGVCDAPA